MRHELPTTITSRTDAVQLWLHLLERGISFHWEDDPAYWVNISGARCLTDDEVRQVSRAFAQVEALDDPHRYDDAPELLRFALELGAETVVNAATPHDLSALERMRASR
ncbi:MAG: hypothetical protein U0228_31175 [Myxococcaceae bacterium]